MDTLSEHAHPPFVKLHGICALKKGAVVLSAEDTGNLRNFTKLGVERGRALCCSPMAFLGSWQGGFHELTSASEMHRLVLCKGSTKTHGPNEPVEGTKQIKHCTLTAISAEIGTGRRCPCRPSRSAPASLPRAPPGPSRDAQAHGGVRPAPPPGPSGTP